MEFNYYHSMETRRKAELRLLELLGHFAINQAEAIDVTFWFYGEEASIYRIAAALKQHDFTILTINQTRTHSDDFLCISSKKINLANDEVFSELNKALFNLAELYDCRFDGHEYEIS